MATKTAKTTARKQTAKRSAGKKSVQLPKPRSQPPAKLLSVWRLTAVTAQTIWRYKTLLGGVTLVYGVLLTLILLRGLTSTHDAGGLKALLEQAVRGHTSTIPSSLSIFVLLAGTAGNSSSTAGAYQFFLAIIVSLAIIWALRQVLAGHGIRIRDAYYRGMYPLVPFTLLLLLIALQLLPAIAGTAAYATVMNNGIAVLGIEKFGWLVIFVASLLLTLYLISSSLFALYIVTLPEMTPFKALRSARELVRYRRLQVMRKLVALPVLLLIAAAVIMVPIIVIRAPLAQWVFFVLSVLSLTVVHTYLYSLYRELLND